MITIQEILNSIYDEEKDQINLSAGSGSETTDGTIYDILNNSFNSSTNTLKTSQ